MAYVASKCSQCGAPIETNNKDKYGVCPYCRTKYTLDNPEDSVAATTNTATLKGTIEQIIKSKAPFLQTPPPQSQGATTSAKRKIGYFGLGWLVSVIMACIPFCNILLGVFVRIHNKNVLTIIANVIMWPLFYIADLLCMFFFGRLKLCIEKTNRYA